MAKEYGIPLIADATCAQMERLKEFVKRKREIRNFYASAFECLVDMGISLFRETPGGSCWLSGLVLPKGKTLDDVRRISGRLREKGIESRAFWKPVHLQKPFKNVPCILKGGCRRSLGENSNPIL